MLSRITVFCFAASYAVALALEVSRLWFRSRFRGAIMLGFGAAGLSAHSIFLVYRASSEALPLSSEFDWYLLAAWLLAAIYLYLTLHFPRTAVGLFTLPLVLGLIGVAQRFADRVPFPQTRASQIWGMIHGSFLLLGTVAVLVGFVTGLMHLVQSYRLKHKLLPTQGFQLPSLEWLEHANSRATVFSALMLALGFASGMLLNLVNRERTNGESLAWTDPVVWSSALLLVWMLAAAVFSLFYKPARQGRKVAYLTVASFLFLVLALGIQLASSSGHGSRGAEGNSFRFNVERNSFRFLSRSLNSRAQLAGIAQSRLSLRESSATFAERKATMTHAVLAHGHLARARSIEKQNGFRSTTGGRS